MSASAGVASGTSSSPALAQQPADGRLCRPRRFKVLVLEGAAQIGGDTISRNSPCRLHPRFVRDGAQPDPEQPADAEQRVAARPLRLRYLSPDPVFTHAVPGRPRITMWRDLDRTCAERLDSRAPMRMPIASCSPIGSHSRRW